MFSLLSYSLQGQVSKFWAVGKIELSQLYRRWTFRDVMDSHISHPRSGKLKITNYMQLMNKYEQKMCKKAL